jgi:hypothetical protein
MLENHSLRLPPFQHERPTYPLKLTSKHSKTTLEDFFTYHYSILIVVRVHPMSYGAHDTIRAPFDVLLFYLVVTREKGRDSALKGTYDDSPKQCR